ncbi:MAG: peptidase S8/S53 subtilisin kexin sedolisin [Acidimicrobiia bacterium]|nr:peptidase S8/S53 subtilisin kexin sedolisin [Acidimicrobiia bacterium]
MGRRVLAVVATVALCGLVLTATSNATPTAPPNEPGPALVRGKSSDGLRHAPVKVRQDQSPGAVEHPLYLNVFAYDVVGKPLVTTTGSPSGYFPSVIKNMLGLTGDGAGQTIAIVVAFDHPYIAADLATFDTTFGLPAPPSFKKVSQTGSTTVLPAPDASWALETSLDVEWAHAIAPKANLLLVEAKSANFQDMMTALAYAGKQTGVSVISNSWGAPEFSTQASFDSYCKLAKALCLFSTGDTGNPGSYPAYNPYALAVGGTTLNLSLDGSLNTVVNSEVAWAGSGGGVSLYETKPAYQNSVNSYTKRGTADVSYDADPATGFPVYDSYPYSGQTGWYQMGGTSAGAPQWAGILAVANQLRVTAKKAVLAAQPTTGVYKAHTTIYGLTSGLADILTGPTNGTCGVICTTKTGYDFVTGKGSPRKGIDTALKAAA